MGDRKHKSKDSKYLFRTSHSASDSNLANDPPGGRASRLSDSGLQSGQSLIEQQSQEATLSPPTPRRSHRFFNWLGSKSRSSSPLRPQSPGVEPSNTAMGQHTATPASPSLTVSPSTPSAPAIRVSSEPNASECPSPVKIGVHAVEPPLDPTHSSTVWAKTLKLVTKKLGDHNLPPLNLTNLTSQSAEENIEAVVKSLNAIQEDNQRKRWSYTWHGKEIVIVERLGEILRSVEKYSQVVGTIVQRDPQVGALVWAGVQGIMRVRTMYS